MSHEPRLPSTLSRIGFKSRCRFRILFDCIWYTDSENGRSRLPSTRPLNVAYFVVAWNVTMRSSQSITEAILRLICRLWLVSSLARPFGGSHRRCWQRDCFILSLAYSCSSKLNAIDHPSGYRFTEAFLRKACKMTLFFKYFFLPKSNDIFELQNPIKVLLLSLICMLLVVVLSCWYYHSFERTLSSGLLQVLEYLLFSGTRI